ncbi:hypothetical protein QFZ80_007314 [Paenibacillus sp. V4I7]|nr:hypothetical protein [Paenibacillus sp. V4I7]
MFFYSSDLRNLGFSIVEGSLYMLTKSPTGICNFLVLPSWSVMDL